MKSGIKLIWVMTVLLTLFILPTTLVSAADQTQQYSKIFLNPFYTPSMSINTNYTFNITVNPPDGISEVKSAIINFDVWMSPTITFTLWVNGKSCNNPSYTISTTFASAGRGVATFDCSNVITKPGFYTVIMKPTQQGTGAATAWLDLTYMNKPGKKLDIFGTEYTVGDSGKVFIQLLENQLTAINNASCYISIYYPSGTKWIDESIMTYQTGSAGLYYYNFNAPSTLGVYMTDIFCEYYTSTQNNNASAYSIGKGWYVNGTGASLTNIDSDYLQTHEYNFNTGAITNLTTVLMAHLDEYSGTSTLDSSASPTTGTHVGPPTIGIPGQAGSAGVSYGAAPGDYTQFSAASKLNLLATENFIMCLSFNESVTNANGNRLISAEATDTIRFSFDGGNSIRFVTDRAGSAAQTVQSPLAYLDNQWHTVCGFQNSTTMLLYIDGSLVATTLAAQSGTMTLSNGIFFGAKDGGGSDAAVSMDEVCYAKGTDANFVSPTPQTIATNYNTYKQCGIPDYELSENVTISGITFFPESFQSNIVTTYRWVDPTITETLNVFLWNYTGSSWYKLSNTLGYSAIDSTVSSSLANISSFVSGGTMIIKINDTNLNTAGRLSLNQVRLEQVAFVEVPANQIRGGGEVHVTNIPRATTDLVNAETPGYVWNYNSRTLTDNGNQLVANAVWNYSGNISPNILNQQTNNVWNYSGNISQNILTQISVSVWNNFNATNQFITLITESVWTRPNRNLTYYEDVTNYTKVGESVWTSSIAIPPALLTQIATAVWSSPSRNLTYTPDMTNYTLVAEFVWNNAIRNLTYYENFGDQVNYTKINSEVPVYVWNYATRNLTYYEHVDMTNYSQAAQYVWEYVNRSLTSEFINNISAQDIWAYTNRTLTYYQNFGDQTNYTKMVEDVWAYVNRSLTYYQNFGDQTNYTLIDQGVANSVWTATNRNLTYYQNFGDQVNYTQIVLGVWNATDRNLTFYPAQVDLTNYTAITENVVNGVWNATDRNLTFYPQQIDLTNYSQIADVVWNANSRNLTFTADVTNYSQIIVGVWNYVDRNLTFYPVQVDLTNYSLISDTVWNASNRSLTYYADVTNYTLIGDTVWGYTGAVNGNLLTQVATAIWSAPNRNLTYYEHVDMTNYTEVANSVWNAAIRNLTFYPTQVDLTNYTLISDTVWTRTDRNLTFYADPTDYNKIFVGVWNNTDRNLTFYPAQIDMTNYTLIIGETANAVWNATDRNLTFYPTQTDLTNYTEIANVVWNAASRNLTYYQNFGDQTNYTEIVLGVWNATDRNLTFYPAQVDLTNYTAITNNVVNGVWNATDRNLTFYPTQIDLTNYTQIAETVWNNPTRNLTYTADVTNYSQIIVGVWNYQDRNLTFYPVQVDLTNYTLINDMIVNSSVNYTLVADNVWEWNGVIVQNILNQIGSSAAQNVWNATDRNLTFYPTQVDLTNYSLISESVWQNLNRTLTDFNFTVSVNETAISNAVWTSVTRTLTDFNFTVTADTNNTAIADAVWAAVNRTLTDYNQSDLTNYNKIQQMVWNATDRNLTYYQNFGDQTNYTLIGDTVWQNLNRTLTDFNFTVSVNESAISNAVWTAVDRTLTSFNFTVEATVNNSALAEAVWSAVNRTLTDYNQSDLTDYNKIQTMVWNATDRNLTYYQNFGDQTNYSLIQQMVWTATQRTLTELNFTVDVNATAIATAVWDSTVRTLTDYNHTDSTNYNLIQTMVWNATTRTLTDLGNLTVNATIDNNAVANAVWTYSNKTVDFATTGNTETVALVDNIANMGHTYVGGTEYIEGENGKVAIRLVRGTGSLAEVEVGANCTISITYPNVSYYVFNQTMTELGDGAYYYNFIVPPVLGVYPYMTNCHVDNRSYFSLDDFHVYENNYSSIPGQVWSAPDRNLTFYPAENNLSAGDVWSYPTRELTFYPTTNLSLTNESIQELGNAVWNYGGTINPNILTQFATTISCTIQNLQSDLNLEWGVHINSC